MNRRIVLISNGNLPSSIVLGSLLDNFHEQIAAVYITTKLPGKKNGNLAEASIIMTRSGIRYLGFKLLYNRLLPLITPGRLLKYRCQELGIAANEVTDINAPNILDDIAQINPDILISVSATQKFSKELLSLAPYPINLHYALLPAYGGISPYVWQLINREKSTGVTVHIMNNQLDCGNILATRTIDISNDSALSLLFKQALAGQALLEGVVRQLLNGEHLEQQPQDLTRRSYYRHPTKADIATLYRSGRKLWRLSDVASLIRAISNPEPSSLS